MSRQFRLNGYESYICKREMIQTSFFFSTKRRKKMDIPWNGLVNFNSSLDTIVKPQQFNLLFIRQRI